MKEAYTSPVVELVLLRADSQLASDNELNFNDFFTKPGDNPIIDDGNSPVTSDPDTDIDLPL